MTIEGGEKVMVFVKVRDAEHLEEALKRFKRECEKNGIRFYRPEPVLCTDNAAMIACAAYYRYREGLTDDLTLDACPVLEF